MFSFETNWIYFFIFFSLRFHSKRIGFKIDLNKKMAAKTKKDLTTNFVEFLRLLRLIFQSLNVLIKNLEWTKTRIVEFWEFFVVYFCEIHSKIVEFFYFCEIQ